MCVEGVYRSRGEWVDQEWCLFSMVLNLGSFPRNRSFATVDASGTRQVLD